VSNPKVRHYRSAVIPTWGRPETSYVVPRDVIRLRTNDPRIVALADRIWDRAPRAVLERRVPAPLALAIEVLPPGEDHRPSRQLDECWRVGTNDVELSLEGDDLYARIECVRGAFVGRVAARLVADQPSLVARLLLETPAAALLARRGYCVLHAGVVTGPGGAVIIRGSAGAGKSTLVAAAHRWGMETLGDESVLAERTDPDDLLAAVRDITVLPDARRLLGLNDALTAPAGGTEGKRRIDLFSSSTPAVRRARRVATVLLGSRNGGPARLEPLTLEASLHEFRRGEIAQEQWSGTPQLVAEHWSRSGAYRLSGTADLAGAVALLVDLVSRPAATRPA
jgi:hypothetical protein